MKRDSYKKIISVFFSLSIFLSVTFGTWFLGSTRAEPGCVWIKVQYADGYPRNEADVWLNGEIPFGTTNASGLVERCNFLNPNAVYDVQAYWPIGTQFGYLVPLETDNNGDGNVTINNHANRSIEIHSPENKTYTTSSVSLNFSFYNSSDISWTGYSLDEQMDVTISGNTIIGGLTNGIHSIIVYGNDTNGYMGYSDRAYFTVNVEHDIAVTNVTPSKTIVCQGYNMNINATVQNLGKFPETFNVTAYANTTEIETQTVNNMPNGTSTILSFMWNTIGFAIGNYTISANATTVTNETETDNNLFVDGIVRVTIPGDIAKPFGFVNILDILYLAVHFGACTCHPETEYDPLADIDNSGVISILDILIIAVNFGKTV